MAEFHRGGVAALLAADAQLDVGTGLAAEIRSHLHQAANAHLIELGEGIGLVDLVVVVAGQELAGVVTAEAEGHLGEVVGAEGEELGFLGDIVSSEGSAGDLDHGADLIVHVAAGLVDELARHGVDDALDVCQLAGFADQGHHDFGLDLPGGTAAAHGQGSLDDGRGLHLGNFGVGDVQTAAAVTHHGVELVQGGDDALQVLHGDVHFLGQSLDVVGLGGQELMERRIQQADGHRATLHGLVDGLEVTLLHGLELLERLLALLQGLGNDHLADGGDAVGIKEHVLGTAQANALGAEVHSLLGVLGGVGVGAHLERAVLVSPAHEAAELTGDGGLGGGDGFAVNVAGGAVDGDPVAFLVDLAGQLKLLVGLVHLDGAAAGDAAGAHAAGDDGGVRGHAAADGEHALGVVHALDVLGRGLQAHQDDLVSLLGPLGGVVGVEDDLAAGGAGGSGETLSHGLGLLEGFHVKLGMEEAVEALGLDHQHGFLLGDHALVHQVAGDLEGGGSGTLAVTGLEHEELLVLNGELHVLHVAVVVLQGGADLGELLIDLGHDLGQLVDGLGGAHAGDHVLALGVHEELTKELLLAGGGVAGKGDAGTGGLAHVAEDHLLDVDGSAPGGGDVVHAAVVDGAGVVPAAEDGLDGAHELLLGILGELLAQLVLVFLLEHVGQLFEILGGELGVQLDAALFLHLVDELLKILLAHFHHHVGIHLDEAAVGVIGEAGVVGLLGKGFHHLVVEAEVEDGVHHAGHGGTGAGADGDQERIVHVTELLAGEILELSDVLHDLILDLGVDGAVIGIVLRAGLGGDGEAAGHGHTQVGHFCQVCALAAQQLAHFSVSFRKQIDEFFSHLCSPFLIENAPA